jgi:hypothetical protein
VAVEVEPQPAKRPAVVGAASCPVDQAQDLTFTGAFAGRLKCSTTPAACLPANGNSLRTIGMTASIGARVGSDPVQLLVVFELVTVETGTYPAGSIGDEPTSSSTGVTLDGIGHWQTQANGGTMTLKEYGKTAASGSVDAALTNGTHAIHVTGSWRCHFPQAAA